MSNETYKVILQKLPDSLEEMRNLPESSLKQPQDTAALTISALCRYPFDPEAALDMLQFLSGPRTISNYEKQFLRDRFRDKDYVPRSYLQGAVPQNNYRPDQPYTLLFFENPYSREAIADGYLTLHIQSGGADSPRQIKLRCKPSTGEWFLWEQFLLSDIRPPVESDPWA